MTKNLVLLIVIFRNCRLDLIGLKQLKNRSRTTMVELFYEWISALSIDAKRTKISIRF